MALITCPECKKQISDTASVCPKCGYSITAEEITKIKEGDRRWRNGCLIGCGSVLGVLILIVAIGTCVEDSPSDSSSREIVQNSEWDGSVWQVKSWLKSNLKDPGSLKFIEWSPVVKNNAGGYMVRVKYRAKNSFGGYVVENKLFHLSSTGTVESAVDL